MPDEDVVDRGKSSLNLGDRPDGLHRHSSARIGFGTLNSSAGSVPGELGDEYARGGPVERCRDQRDICDDEHRRPQTSTLRPGSPSAVGSVARTHPTEVRRRPLRAHLPSHVATKHLSDHRVRSTRLSPYRVCVTSKVCSLPISRLRHVAWCVGDLGGCVIIVRPRRGADE